MSYFSQMLYNWEQRRAWFGCELLELDSGGLVNQGDKTFGVGT